MRGVQGIVARFVDGISVVVGALLATDVRFGGLVEGTPDTAYITFAVALTLVIFPAFGMYDSWRGRSLPRQLSQVALAWCTVQAIGLVLTFSLHRVELVSRLWLVYWTAIAACFLLLSRVGAHYILSRARNAGINIRNVALVGDGIHTEAVKEKIRITPGSGFRVAAAYNTRLVSAPHNCAEKPFDEFGDFVDYVRQRGIQEIWLALPLSEEASIHRFVSEFSEDLVNVRFIPDVKSVALFDGGVIDLVGAPAINLIASPLASRSLVKKEIFDRLFALAALTALTPLLFGIAIAVKASSSGPVFFRQSRKGADGRTFRIFKFRTMRQHAEVAGIVTQATRGDPRITRVGAFLRRTSLDELPQFINVLKGEMSVVGPRPHAIEHDEIYRKVVNGYIHRYRAKPGITGWAQVNGFRGETDRIEKMVKRIEHDLYYLQNWSFALDMRIVIATVIKGFAGSNAY